MLVLSRKVKEALIIDGNIKITVVAVEGDRVRLAVEAPREVTVYRQELYEAIQAENRAAAQVDVGLTSLLPRLPEGNNDSTEY